jgi:hypothetical protein
MLQTDTGEFTFLDPVLLV